MFPITWNVSVFKGVVWFWLGVEQVESEKLAVGFFLLFWYSKDGICDAFYDAFATRPPFPWDPRPTCPTLTTILTLKLTPRSWQTRLYFCLVSVGSGNFTTDTFHPTLRSVDYLIGFWTEQPEDRDAFRRTRIDGWKKCQLTHRLVSWPIYQQRREDAYLRTQIDGDGDGSCLFQIPYINIHLLIDRSIYWSIYQWTDETGGGRDTSVGH